MKHIAKSKALDLFQSLSQDQRSNLRDTASRSKTLYEFSKSAWGLPSDKEIEDAAKKKGIRNVWTEDSESFVEMFRDLYLSELWEIGLKREILNRTSFMDIVCEKRGVDILSAVKSGAILMRDIVKFGSIGYIELSDDELIDIAIEMDVLPEAINKGYVK